VYFSTAKTNNLNIMLSV